ncbi:uncharacterized protein LOC141668891 isoform X1 [Apium graveolens]|uniref:uncharacterized protein LOC141668891 isoform X1 n=1 Tax=Apium graveolens TaxID=4045 RepID=UPI003D7A6DA0
MNREIVYPFTGYNLIPVYKLHKNEYGKKAESCNKLMAGMYQIGMYQIVMGGLLTEIWPTKCVYNFLDKSVELSSLCEITGVSLVKSTSLVVKTQQPLCVSGPEGFLIPPKAHGNILKLINENTTLLRWECTQSGIDMGLLRLVHKIDLDRSKELIVMFDLLCLMVIFSMAACNVLISTGNTSVKEAIHVNGNLHEVNSLELICSLVKWLTPMMSMSVIIWTRMLYFSPSYASIKLLKANIFDIAFNMNPLSMGSSGLSSRSWLLSGRLAKKISIDCEQNESYCPFLILVWDFTKQLVETKAENDVVLAFVIFSIQYDLVNYEYWNYKMKDVWWKGMRKWKML